MRNCWISRAISAMRGINRRVRGIKEEAKGVANRAAYHVASAMEATFPVMPTDNASRSPERLLSATASPPGMAGRTATLSAGWWRFCSSSARRGSALKCSTASVAVPLARVSPAFCWICRGASDIGSLRHQPRERGSIRARVPRAAFASTSELRDALSVRGDKNSTMRCRKKLRDPLSVRTCQIAELSVAVLVGGPRLELPARPQRESHLAHQAGDRGTRQDDPAALQALGECTERAVGPLHAGGRVPGGGIRQQRLQGLQDSGELTSTRLRPAPGRRTRSDNARSPWYNSRRPRAMVLRSRPVMRARRAIPPWPYCWASKPTTSRRRRSSVQATRRLIAWCSRATAPSGSRWQAAQPQRWMPRASFFVVLAIAPTPSKLRNRFIT